MILLKSSWHGNRWYGWICNLFDIHVSIHFKYWYVLYFNTSFSTLFSMRPLPFPVLIINLIKFIQTRHKIIKIFMLRSLNWLFKLLILVFKLNQSPPKRNQSEFQQNYEMEEMIWLNWEAKSLILQKLIDQIAKKHEMISYYGEIKEL